MPRKWKVTKIGIPRPGEKKRPHKYGAKRTLYDGQSYPSQIEAAHARKLDILLAGKAIASWRRNPTVTLKVYGKYICKYTLDFEVTHLDGQIELVEVKGLRTREWANKWRLFEAIYEVEHPEILRTIAGR